MSKVMREDPSQRYFLKGCHQALMSDVQNPDYILESDEVKPPESSYLELAKRLINGPVFRFFAGKVLGEPSSSFPIDVRLLHKGGDIEIRKIPSEVKTEDLELKPLFSRLFSEHAPYVNGPNQDWVRFNETHSDTLPLSARLQKLELSKTLDGLLRPLLLNQHSNDSRFKQMSNSWTGGFKHADPQEAQEDYQKKIDALQTGTPIQTIRTSHQDDVSSWYDNAQSGKLTVRSFPKKDLIYP